MRRSPRPCFGAVVAVWAARRHNRRFSLVLPASWPGITGRKATSLDRLREIEVHFYALLTWPATRIARVFFWHWRSSTRPQSPRCSLCCASSRAARPAGVRVETTGWLIVVVFKFVPTAWASMRRERPGRASGHARSSVGVILALVRRIRILIWNGVGLVLFTAARLRR